MSPKPAGHHDRQVFFSPYGEQARGPCAVCLGGAIDAEQEQGEGFTVVESKVTLVIRHPGVSHQTVRAERDRTANLD